MIHKQVRRCRTVHPISFQIQHLSEIGRTVLNASCLPDIGWEPLLAVFYSGGIGPVLSASLMKFKRSGSLAEDFEVQCMLTEKVEVKQQIKPPI